MNDCAARFRGHWQDFLSRLSVQIRRSGGKQTPSFTQMQMILRCGADDWLSGETRCGRWLMEMGKQDARKAALIREIFQSDMCFLRPAAVRGNIAWLQSALPAAGALAGFTVSYLLHAPVWGVALSSLGAGAALIPAGKCIGDKSGERAAHDGAAAYLAQLDKYYQSILSILES